MLKLTIKLLFVFLISGSAIYATSEQGLTEPPKIQQLAPPLDKHEKYRHPLPWSLKNSEQLRWELEQVLKREAANVPAQAL